MTIAAPLICPADSSARFSATCHLLDPDEPPGGLGRQHDVGDHLLLRDAVDPHLVLELLLDDGRPDVARADGVHRDPQLRDLEGDGLREPDDAVLGRHVGALVGRGHQAVDRGDVDHAPPAALLHARERRARGVEGRGEVDREDRVPALHGELVHGGDVLDARVVHQDVERAELLLGGLHHFEDLRRLRHVRGMVERAHAVVLHDPREQGLDGPGLAQAVHHQVGAPGSEGAGDAQPDAARGSRHQHRLPREFPGHPFPPSGKAAHSPRIAHARRAAGREKQSASQRARFGRAAWSMRRARNSAPARFRSATVKAPPAR